MGEKEKTIHHLVLNPMENPMKLLDTVALLDDMPTLKLYRGQVGTIVEVYEPPDVFEVEFCDLKGRTYALETLQASQLMLPRHELFEERKSA